MLRCSNRACNSPGTFLSLPQLGDTTWPANTVAFHFKEHGKMHAWHAKYFLCQTSYTFEQLRHFLDCEQSELLSNRTAIMMLRECTFRSYRPPPSGALKQAFLDAACQAGTVRHDIVVQFEACTQFLRLVLFSLWEQPLNHDDIEQFFSPFIFSCCKSCRPTVRKGSC